MNDTYIFIGQGAILILCALAVWRAFLSVIGWYSFRKKAVTLDDLYETHTELIDRVSRLEIEFYSDLQARQLTNKRIK